MNAANIIPSKGIYEYIQTTSQGKNVMWKCLKNEYRDKAPYQALLRKEFETLQKLEHANIVQQYSLENTEYGTTIVEEWVEGRSLSAYLKENHSTEEKIRIVKQIAAALHQAHQKNIQHRNLKASNILVAQQGDQVKIIDFRMPFADDLHVKYTSMLHISPEQKDGTVVLDARSDIFSLGTLMKSMQIGDAYAEIIEKSCSYSRGDRYMDMEDFLDALEGNTKTTTGTKPAVWLVALLAVVLVAGAFFFFYTRENATDTPMAQSTQAVSNAPSDDTHAEQTASSTQEAAPAAEQAKKFTEQTKAQMAIDLNAVYQPYISGTSTDRAKLQAQVKRYYKGLQRALSPLSDEEQAAFDKAFIEIKQNLEKQLP